MAARRARFRPDETLTFKHHVVKILLPNLYIAKIHRTPDSEKSISTHISQGLRNPKNGVSHRRSPMFFGRTLSGDEFVADVFWTSIFGLNVFSTYLFGAAGVAPCGTTFFFLSRGSVRY